MHHTLILLSALGCAQAGDPMSTPANTPEASASHEEANENKPPLDDVVALEVIADARRSTRHSTRDPARVRAALDTLNTGTWTPGNMPRCMPALWVRFVPPSAEDAITAVFCRADSNAAFWVPGGRTLHLDAATSHALYQALLPVASADGGPIPPTAVTDNLDSFSLSLTLREPAPDGLGRLTLTTDPAAPKDAPKGSTTIVITTEQAGVLAVALETSGLFSRSKTYHEPAVAAPGSAPPVHSSDAAIPALTKDGRAEVSVVAGDWRRIWREDASQPIFAHILSVLEREDPIPEAAASIAALKSQVQ